ncbi:MAG: alpha-L-fucosidase [Saprospiraceae bacterium]|nr:alpha-L-fucosidase [Saprospiraceae bacterium]
MPNTLHRFVLAVCLAGILSPAFAQHAETPAQHDQRMAWWREARFGMFIHWGLYAIPAGEWGGATNYGEWIRHSAQIPLETYDQFVHQFNPTAFNAEAWVQMAKDAGMKYIVITSKHHDGFCLWDSKETDFDVASTPFRRDILKELADACRKIGGVKLCFYHSIMDWHHPDYTLRRGWEKDRPLVGADRARFIIYLKNQLKELVTSYGDIGVLWFDGEWEEFWTHADGKDLYNYVRSLKPDIIVNNRVDKGRGGMAGMTSSSEYAGDFGTPEQEIPETGLPGVDWESCMTMNDNWGYNKNDLHFKTSEDLLRKLADIASKGGNFLLNIGPKADGTFPQQSIDRLRDIGAWMRLNGESIYGTSASPFHHTDWGRVTQKSLGKNSRLYFHVFDWPKSGLLEVHNLGNTVTKAYLLAGGQAVPFRKKGFSLSLQLPAAAPDPVNTVIVVEIKGAPEVFHTPQIEAYHTEFISAMEVALSLPGRQGKAVLRYTTDGTTPGPKSAVYRGPFKINKNTLVQARSFVGKTPVSETAQQQFTRVTPPAPASIEGAVPGIKAVYYEGNWDKLPDFKTLKPVGEEILPSPGTGRMAGKDHYGIVFEGYIDIPADDIYRFILASDDGSRLYVNNRLVVDNDGLHGAREVGGAVPLLKGLNAIRIEFFEKSGDESLSLSFESRNGSLKVRWRCVL